MSIEMIELIHNSKAYSFLMSLSIRTGAREALNEGNFRFLYRAYRYCRLFLFYVFST
jgi:hypothetical protein